MMVRVITPAGVFFEGEAILAEFAGGGGKMGVYARHSPLTVSRERWRFTGTGKKETPFWEKGLRKSFRTG